MTAPVTIYVIKDATTRGILQTSARILPDGCAEECQTNGAREDWYWIYRPSQYRRTMAEATAEAERKRAEKAAALRLQLNALEELDLTKPSSFR